MPILHTTIPHSHRARGFSMVEVLVTLVVLSIGLLGVAGLQLTGLRSNQSAYYRSQATLIVYDMIDRMRTNPDGIAANSYDAIDSTAALPTDPSCINTSGGCSAASLAANDIREWVNENLSLLPSGSGSVTRNGNIFTVTANWIETSDAADPNKSVTIGVQL